MSISAPHCRSSRKRTKFLYKTAGVILLLVTTGLLFFTSSAWLGALVDDKPPQSGVSVVVNSHQQKVIKPAVQRPVRPQKIDSTPPPAKVAASVDDVPKKAPFEGRQCERGQRNSRGPCLNSKQCPSSEVSVRPKIENSTDFPSRSGAKCRRMVAHACPSAVTTARRHYNRVSSATTAFRPAPL